MIRVPEEYDGLNLSLLNATLMMEDVGRTQASGSIAEAVIGAHLLEMLGVD